jgi:hypothetical protein
MSSRQKVIVSDHAYLLRNAIGTNAPGMAVFIQQPVSHVR